MNNDGCFEHCTECILKNNCCTNFNNINNPVLNEIEVNKIKDTINIDDFYDYVDKNLYTLKLNNNNCIFFKNDMCSIYNYRPCDCKLFPYDIIYKDNKYYLILYKLNCLNIHEFYEINKIDSLINEIKPWIENFTDKRNYTKMNNIDYIIIREIKKES